MRIPRTPPPFLELLSEFDPSTFSDIVRRRLGPTVGSSYRHWHKLLFLNPPEGLTHRQWWLALKLARQGISKDLPLASTDDRPFTFCMPDAALELVLTIDRDAAGQIVISDTLTNPATREKYIVNSLMEEAITSSQLEGASTTREVAKELLRSGRRPRDRDERMILNNYMAMEEVRKLKESELSPDVILSLHRIVTEGTLDSPDAAGRLRRHDEAVEVVDERDGVVLHTPPGSSLLEARMVAMCEFANKRSPAYFIHPVIRAILLHLWLAYDHPFVDGNGRTARALFYWSMLRDGYWMLEFLSISDAFRRARARYARAFLYSETDDFDATYFIMYHLRAIRTALDRFQEYLRSKIEEVRRAEIVMQHHADLNYRQVALLSHALRNPGTDYTISYHQNSNRIVYQTARTDLLDLVARGWLLKRKRGRKFYFVAPEDLSARLDVRPRR